MLCITRSRKSSSFMSATVAVHTADCDCLLAGKAQGYSCLFPGFAGLLNPRRGISPSASCHIPMNAQGALLRAARIPVPAPQPPISIRGAVRRV